MSDSLFFSIWRNNYIKLNIFKCVKIYKKNRVVSFYSYSQLLNYQYREYIEEIRIKYTGSQFKHGDLPNSGVLKTVYLMDDNDQLNQCGNTTLSIIPDSVTTIKYSYKQYLNKSTSLYTLPITVNTISNVDVDPEKKHMSSHEMSNYGVFQYFSVIDRMDKPTIPSNITSISFSDHFNYKIPNGFIGSNVTYLRFGNEFNNWGSPFQIGDIPLGLKELHLGGKNITPNDVLPNSVTKLSLCLTDTKLQVGIIPDSIKYLNLYQDETDYEQIVIYTDANNTGDVLPNGIETLIIETRIILSNIQLLPNSLTYLKLYSFDFPVVKKGDLPIGLKYFLFSSRIDNQVFEIGSFPNGLETLLIESKFQQIQPMLLPTSLKLLKLPSDYKHPLEIGSLPNSLLEFYSGIHEIQLNVLPNSLKSLHLSCDFKYKLIIGSLPNQLEKLELSFGYTHALVPGLLPNSITHLQIGSYYNHPLSENVLPPNLKTLTFMTPIVQSEFNQPLQEFLPPSLQYLFIGNPNYNHPINYSKYKTPEFIKSSNIKRFKPKKQLQSLL